ncbi:MAG TPA: DUF5752 family protein [Nitrospiraceae bacterium]|jgi:hypothetical protein|nr:DUF5752 family protein [Nitrospiraceae bacterium]
MTPQEREKRRPSAAATPFTFIGCSELQELLGKKANDEKELAELLEEVPVDSVYFHTHSYFLRHSAIAGAYANDFAHWVVTQVRDRVLGERLAVLDPFDFASLEELREEIISIIDDHLSRTSVVPRVIFGEPFHFNQSRIIEVPTGLQACTLPEFRNALAEVDASAIYYHMFEARVRLRREESDFSFWVRQALGLPDLAARLRAINPYVGSLERLRSALLVACDEFLDRTGEP